MTDPKELRAAALDHREWCHESHHDVPPWVDYILATVRDDDGEEQPDAWVGIGDGEGIVTVTRHGVFLRTADSLGQIRVLDIRPTRGQFRALCRGLGITPAAATPETPG